MAFFTTTTIPFLFCSLLLANPSLPPPGVSHSAHPTHHLFICSISSSSPKITWALKCRSQTQNLLRFKKFYQSFFFLFK